jgi:hypothetical protein
MRFTTSTKSAKSRIAVHIVRILLRQLAIVALVAMSLPACGGDGGGSVPPPSPTPPPQDPCVTAGVEVPEGEQGEALPEESAAAAAKLRRTRPAVDLRRTVYDSLWGHAAAVTTRALFTQPPRAATEDVGEIAVVQDEGDLLIAPNPFDLKGVGLRFTRNGATYDVSRVNAAFRQNLGTRVVLEDDDSESFTLPFTFAFYDKTQPTAFVNSDGNITFEEEDRASTERNVTRVMTGPPRVAPFFADLDPTTGSGRVFVQSAADAFTVTWCAVRGFDKTETVTVQSSLLPNGDVEVKFGGTVDLGDAIVALSPGRTGQFATLDLSMTGTLNGGDGALGERFARTRDLDLVATARKFYQSHPDNYDQLVIWTNVAVTDDAFAFETIIANEIRGIGVDVLDQSRAFGSAGRLRSLVMMDTLGKYPADPQTRFLGENNTVSLIGQEAGHRWLAFLRFRDHDGRRSDALLGRDQAHWSFFMDSDASVMEGNDIEDLGGGSFRTVAAVRRYSALDQYAMGLVTSSQVAPFFYVENPVNVSPSRDAEDAPRVGVTFNGTKRTVLLQDVVAVMGARQPAAGQGARVFRQAFIFVPSNGTTAAASEVAKVDLIRRQWETFFERAVNGRARAETRLRPGS